MSVLDVAVNLLWVAPGRVGGSEPYLERQLLGVDDAGLRLTLYCTRSFAEAHRALGNVHRFVVAPGGQDFRGGRIVAEHSWLAYRTRSADLVHHGGGTAPLVGHRPIVLTIHDLQYRTFPQYFSRVRHTYLDVMMPRSVRRAAVVTTPSEYVRGTVIDAFGVDPDRVRVVPHGVPPIGDPTADDIERARVRAGVGSAPFVVYPAITHPHKGHLVLVDMLAHADPELHLVLPGGEGAAERALREAIATSGCADRVHRVGRVSDSDRDALIAGAEALVFPSAYEGFGAPLVEAMALGTPVVCSAAAAVVEVVGDAAVVVPEPTGEGWSAAVDVARRRSRDLIAAGHVRRAEFTTEVSGKALARAYRDAAGAPS